MFTIGQKLWLVPFTRYYRQQEVEIANVGRKYLTLTNKNRVDKDTLIISNIGACYLSEDAYRASIATEEAWKELLKRLEPHRWKAPDGISFDEIEQVGKLIFSDAW